MRTPILEGGAAGAPAPAPSPLAQAALKGDDKAMLKLAANLTRDLNQPDARLYWADTLGSAALGYGAVAVALTASGWPLVLGAALVAVLALYRAGLFIHEITHLKAGALPGYRMAWNLVVGIPMLAPSFLYEGIHNMHHAKIRYGTAEDPEYLPLALMKPWTLPLFVAISLLGPVALLFRFAVLTPLSLLSPRLRDVVVGKYSGLQINPRFVRKRPEGAFKRQWFWMELGAWAWATSLVALVATGTLPLRSFLIGLGIASAAMLLNQVRTLVAHLWENDGEPMSVTEQYLDSVNVPGPGLLPALWAPVGLRFHALHHLLPGVPYHALGQAHRRLMAELGADSAYHRSHHAGLWPLVGRLWKRSRAGAAAA